MTQLNEQAFLEGWTMNTLALLTGGQDDIFWIHAIHQNNELLFFHTEPFLPCPNGVIPAKLIYASYKPYGTNSVRQNTVKKKTMYSVAYRLENHKTVHVSDSEIQKSAQSAGFQVGYGAHANLSIVKHDIIVNLFPSIRLLDRFPSDEGYNVSSIVAQEYGINTHDIRLTGGAQINENVIRKQHDLDVIIPIESYEHAERVWRKIRGKSENHIIEHGFKSPMRWYAKNSYMICPFFIYGKMDIPILDMRLGPIVEKKVVVVDSRLSLFNMPLFEVIGELDFVAFRSRIVRAAISEGMALHVNSYSILVTKGNWKGRKGVLITNPFDQVHNLSHILSKWNA